MQGELVHLTLFDAGSELDLARVGTILGATPHLAPLVVSSAAPPYAGFPEPLEVIFDRDGARIEVRVHRVGVIVVRIRIPIAGNSLSDLGPLARSLRVRGLPLREAAHAWCAEIRRDLDGALVEPYDIDAEPETYLVYCITDATRPEDLVRGQREQLAALVTGEAPGALAPGVVDSALKHTFRYYVDDMVVIGWDNAIVLGRPGSYEDTLDVMELANLELLEFRTYDAYLDRRLDASFASLDRLWQPGGLFRSARGTLREISELRVDFARLTDNLHDTGKLFGDWYVAKLHAYLREAFHMASWERAIATKMATLEDMFQLAEEEARHRRSMFLEAIVVLLFVLDLIILVVVGVK